MAGLMIRFDETSGELVVGDIPRASRTQKGKSLLCFPDSYVVIDIETTGLDPRFDEIIELAGLKYEHGKETDAFESLVKPEIEVDDFITELTGITNEMLEDAPSIAEVLPKFIDFIGSNIVIGHNVNFDINFIYDNAEQLGLPAFSNDFVDTMRISRRLYKDMENHKLSTLVSYLGVSDSVEHRAFSDCANTQMCLIKMQEYAEQIGGIPQSKDFDKMAKSITPETSDFNLDSPIYKAAFAFTGKLDRMTRREAMQAVANAGGINCDKVTMATNYLVLGNNDYCKAIKDGKSNKQKKAEKMQLAGADISIISEDVFLDMLNT